MASDRIMTTCQCGLRWDRYTIWTLDWHPILNDCPVLMWWLDYQVVRRDLVRVLEEPW